MALMDKIEIFLSFCRAFSINQDGELFLADISVLNSTSADFMIVGRDNGIPPRQVTFVLCESRGRAFGGLKVAHFGCLLKRFWSRLMEEEEENVLVQFRCGFDLIRPRYPSLKVAKM